jgi:hypothetical protein
MITIRLFPAAFITYIAHLTNRSRSLDASVPTLPRSIPKCRSSDVLQKDALKPFRHPPSAYRSTGRYTAVNLTSRYTLVGLFPFDGSRAREFTRFHRLIDG